MTSSFTRITHLSVFRASTEPIKKFVVGIVLSPVIIGMFWIIVTLLLSLGKASGAIVITELTLVSKNAFVADPDNELTAWAQIQAGNRSALGGTTDADTEVFVNNLTAPVEKGQYTWNPGAMANSISDSFIISYNSSIAELSVTPGSGTKKFLSLTQGFNTLLITIRDTSTIGATSFNGSVGGDNFSWSVDNGLKYYEISLGEDSPDVNFNVSSFVAGAAPSGGDVRFTVDFYDDMSASIPEPSSVILTLIGMIGSLFVRRR